ncbi:MAG: hypothetical protein O2816_16580, partial [Planctomycetota bacterium]|nr:hypothetical protein [Planctomycetota bacterium]
MPPNKTLALLLAVPLASSTLVLGQDDPATPPTQQQPQQQPQRPAPGTREAMWPAPSAADWAKPCLIQWERSWEDALAVAEETGKPMLVCVNMDGELASEHYAGVRYRMQEIADLYAPYICVMASVYRHNPSDYDHEGNRIPCPRFGHVTCGEHIAIEPVLYEKYFEGTRVAPRHIMIELDREEQYDVYYAFDTQSVFDTIVQGVQNRENPIPPVNREDRPIEERVNSRAHLDKVAVEQAFRAGDVSVRRKLLRRAVEARDNASVDLLRLAIFGFDVELARLGREGLLYSNSEKAIDLIGEALRVPLPTEERERLIAALERLGETYPRARTLARVHTGLGGDSQLVDLDGWSEVEAGRPQPREWSALESAVDYSTQRATSAPEDGAAHLDVAESTLAIAVDPRRTGGLITGARTDQKFSELLFLDAQASARKAEQLGATGWRLDAMLSLTAWYLGDREEGYRRAEQAVAALPAGAQDWSAMGVLSLFADQRRRDITQALRAREEWPPAWLTDLHAAYAVLARHPYGTDGLVIDQIDFLNYMGAFAPAAQLLDVGMQRFPDSALMHDRLRSR